MLRTRPLPRPASAPCSPCSSSASSSSSSTCPSSTSRCPSMQAACDLGATGLQWVVNGYTIAFAGFLLLGGRAADLIGQRRAFLAGRRAVRRRQPRRRPRRVPGVLVAGRVVQGLGAAVLVARDADDPPRLVPRGPAARPGRWAGGRRSARPAARPAASSAARSPSGCRGAGCCWSTCRSASPSWWPRPGCSTTSRASAGPRLDVPGAAAGHRGPRRARPRHHADRAARLDRRRRRSCRSRSRRAARRRSSRSSDARAEPLMPLVAPAPARPRGGERRHARVGRRAVRDLVLPHAVHAAGARLVAAAGRGRVPAPHPGDRRGHAGHGPLAVGARPAVSCISAALPALGEPASGCCALPTRTAATSSGVAIPGVLVMFGAGLAFPPVIGAATAGVGPTLHGLASGVDQHRPDGRRGARPRRPRNGRGLAHGGRRRRAAGAGALVTGFHAAYVVAAGTMVPRPRSPGCCRQPPRARAARRADRRRGATAKAPAARSGRRARAGSRSSH